MAACVAFDRGPLPDGTLFAKPLRLIEAWSADAVPQAFAALEAAVAEGRWLAGYASYELGYALIPKLTPLLPAERELPLLQFGVFERPEPAPADATTEAGSLEGLQPLWDRRRYGAAFRAVRDYIAAGDIYQANLTFPLAARYSGSVAGLYARLRAHQPVPQGALVALGETALLSRSPELFFSLSAEGALTARPMKGTAPRGTTAAEDAALAAGLAASEKDRAENLMIVDLLRNDLGRVAEIGSVRVPELFAVERYRTLHQMTSLVRAQLHAGTGIAEIFAALFPCGSITGAPKIRAMEILRELEPAPRGAYCGAIGWIAPDRSMAFNVAIRTLTCRADGTALLNVGGGVVYDSTEEGEYAEALLKARFALLP